MSSRTLLLLLSFLIVDHAVAFLNPVSPRTTPLSALQSTTSSNERSEKKKKAKVITLKDLREEIKRKPTEFLPDTGGKGKNKKYRRTRKRVENPQQQYVYAHQQRKAQSLPEGGDETAEASSTPAVQPAFDSIPVSLARDYGLTNPASQHCDPLVDDVEPELLGQVRVGEELKSGSYAYVIHKPAGWSILGGAGKRDAPSESSQEQPQPSNTRKNTKKTQITRLEITDLDGSLDALEYSEADLLAVMTPEEIEEYKAELQNSDGESVAGKSNSKVTKKVRVRVDEEDEEEEEIFHDELEEEEVELLAELNEEELAIYEAEFGKLPDKVKKQIGLLSEDAEEEIPTIQLIENDSYFEPPEMNVKDPEDPETKKIMSKIDARKSAANSNRASFMPAYRPSVVAWLKDLKAKEGSPMKGGNYWTALAGAVDVDDSGIVVLCPKEHVDNVFVDYLEYVAVVGNAKNLTPKPKGAVSIPSDELKMDIRSSLRRNRGEDAIQTVKVMVPEKFSSCSSILLACQKQFQDGIRGDPGGNPLGRLANRRLMHCNAVSLSSLVFDESVEVETEAVPDDIAILAERRNQHQYKDGSFLGRAALRRNPLTTAYREINGAADGFPGWTVDRYDKWLFVQHDQNMDRGPLPSIHDGNTAGVYYLPAHPNRSAMGSSQPSEFGTMTRPQLLEGQPAPEIITILENGIKYHVSLDKDLSTGLFLDQRPQRAWLARNCNENTHVLNCFAHCGGFSIAAATAGAATTSLDLNKKWLDRVEPQMNANGIDFDIRHDCIYGDCFEWLAKLAKRGEKYDIVILDPPSSSVGGKKKKRWSLKNDMPELVALAAKVVKKGGLLWTTTNSASITPVRFARLCKRGLEEAGHGSAKLERIAPMPHDFPSIGEQPVKNYVWRLP